MTLHIIKYHIMNVAVEEPHPEGGKLGFVDQAHFVVRLLVLGGLAQDLFDPGNPFGLIPETAHQTLAATQRPHHVIALCRKPFRIVAPRHKTLERHSSAWTYLSLGSSKHTPE
jgi:hypothetical protein